jgi:hypothetical protein
MTVPEMLLHDDTAVKGHPFPRSKGIPTFPQGHGFPKIPEGAPARGRDNSGTAASRLRDDIGTAFCTMLCKHRKGELPCLPYDWTKNSPRAWMPWRKRRAGPRHGLPARPSRHISTIWRTPLLRRPLMKSTFSTAVRLSLSMT